MEYNDPQDFKLMPELRHAFPAGAKGYTDLSAAVFDPDDDVLPVRTRELMAVAVAATTQCPYCLHVHVGNAKKAGASKDEVARAVMVSSALRAGAAMAHGYLAMKVYEQGDDLTAYSAPEDVKYHRTLRQHGGGALEAMAGFDAAVFDPEDDVLDLKTRELMAISVAATTQCPYCIQAHVGNAKKAGASMEEVARAVAVSSALRAGAAHTHGLLATKIYDEA